MFLEALETPIDIGVVSLVSLAHKVPSKDFHVPRNAGPYGIIETITYTFT